MELITIKVIIWWSIIGNNNQDIIRKCFLFWFYLFPSNWRICIYYSQLAWKYFKWTLVKGFVIIYAMYSKDWLYDNVMISASTFSMMKYLTIWICLVRSWSIGFMVISMLTLLSHHNWSDPQMGFSTCSIIIHQELQLSITLRHFFFIQLFVSYFPHVTMFSQRYVE